MEHRHNENQNYDNILPDKKQFKQVTKIDINNPETLVMDFLYKKQLMRTYETFRSEKQEKSNSNDGNAQKAFLDDFDKGRRQQFFQWIEEASKAD